MAFIILFFALVSLISLLYSFKPSIVSKRTIFITLKLKTTQSIDETVASEQQQTISKRTNNLSDGSYDYNQWSKAFISQPIEMNYEVTEIEGQIPLGFEGILYRNMPALFERGNVSYGHYLDGDGCVTKLTIKNNKVYFMSKYVTTEEYINENEQQKILYRNTFRTQRPMLLDPIFNKICLNNAFDLKLKNPANTNVVYWGGKLSYCSCMIHSISCIYLDYSSVHNYVSYIYYIHVYTR